MNSPNFSRYLRQTLAVMLATLMVIALVPHSPGGQALAFKPTEGLVATPNDITHERMTKEALRELLRSGDFIPGVTNITPSMTRAIDAVFQGNRGTDIGPRYIVGEAHFTEETFQSGQSLIHEKFNTMVKSLNNRDPHLARVLLGQIFHALQDFYAHSNWVEKNGNSININQVLGMPDQNFDSGSLAGKNEETCRDCNKCHPSCGNNITTPRLTSAYFGLYPNSTKPRGKCSHGSKPRTFVVPNPLYGFPLNLPVPPFIVKTINFDFTEDHYARGGINKDTMDCEESPHSYIHMEAAGSAYGATRRYLEQVVKAKLTPRQLRDLFGVSRDLAFFVDTTGSMSTEIAGVRQRLTQFVNARRGTDLEPSNYLLMPVNDPDVGPVTYTEDPDVFISALSGLGSGGGGDCPELQQTALLQGLPLLAEGSDAILITNASARDNHLAASVRSISESKDLHVTTIATGSCSPIDPEYYRTARATGGQVFVISPNETGEISKLVDFVVRPSSVELFSITDTMAGDSKTFTIPVDSTMTRATFSVSGTTGAVLKRPDGTTVQPTDAGVETASVSGGDVFSIVNPASGQWSITIDGAGEVSLRVSGESLLDLASFKFVEIDGGAGHEGYFPISGSPLPHRTSKVVAEMSPDQVGSARFEFRSVTGETLKILDLTRIADPQGAPPELSGSNMTKQFIGDVVVPDGEFLVYVTGLDTNGQTYQRLLPGTVKPQSVRVIAQPLEELRPGQATTYSFQVQNFGEAGMFQISAVDTKGYIRSITPKVVKLSPGETNGITVQLQPPDDADTGTLDKITFTAQNTKNPDLSNFAVVETMVAKASPIRLGAVTTTSAGGGENVVAPGTTNSLNVRLNNAGNSSVKNLSAMLVTLTPGVEITSGESLYPDVDPSGSTLNNEPFTFKLSSSVPCGQIINFTLLVRHDGYVGPVLYNFSVPTGRVNEDAGQTTTVSYSGVPVPIPDANPTGVSVPITVSGFSGTLGDLNFRFDGNSCTAARGATSVGLDHSYVGDLEVKLTSPQGTTVTLIKSTDNSGNNFCSTLLDDDADASPISFLDASRAPFSGSFTPSSPLAAFIGEDPNGTWTLHVSDLIGGDVGSVRAFSLLLNNSQRATQCDTTVTDAADLLVTQSAVPASVLTGSNITYTLTVTNNGPGAARSVTLTDILPANTSFVSCIASDGGMCSGVGNNRSITFDSIPLATSVTATIVANVACLEADSTALSNVATVQSSTPDPDTANNSSAVTISASNPPPVITNAVVDQPELWSPNHKMVDVEVNYNVTDNCGPTTNTLSVTSNELVDGTADGDTSPDWEVIDAHHVRLRAERSGRGNGRIYTIMITSTDSAGNSSNQPVTVRVPKSRR